MESAHNPGLSIRYDYPDNFSQKVKQTNLNPVGWVAYFAQKIPMTKRPNYSAQLTIFIGT